MARPDKVDAVAELTEHFRSSSAAVLTEYRGLTVSQLKELRRAMGSSTTYAVVKNTLTKIAARDAGMPPLDNLLAGPSAIAFVKGDPVEAAKGLRDFAKAHPMLVIKGGVLDGKPLEAKEITRLADLESREVLLAKLAGAMQASMANAAALFQAPLTQAARLAEALRAKAAEDPSVLRGGAGEPAASAAPAPAEGVAEESPADAQAADADTASADAAESPEVAAPAAEAGAPEADTTESAGGTDA